MKKVSRFFTSVSSFGKAFGKAFAFRKVIFSAVVFISVFYFHHWTDRHGKGVFLAIEVSEVNSAQEEEIAKGTLNLNTASLKELIALPGIGPKIAEEIVKDRKRNGPFLQLEDFLRVKGIGPKKLEKIAPFLHFEAPPK